MTNGRKPPMPTPTMPRANTLPPTTHNIDPVQDEYAEEAGRAAQRFHDMRTEIGRLTLELETWRSRAVVAEDGLKRADQREKDLHLKLENVAAKLTHERDVYRDRLTTLKAEFATAGNIILHCIKVSEDMMTLGERVEAHDHLEKLAQELDEPLPKVVTDGPRES
jgi:hypothetical protein